MLRYHGRDDRKSIQPLETCFTNITVIKRDGLTWTGQRKLDSLNKIHHVLRFNGCFPEEPELAGSCLVFSPLVPKETEDKWPRSSQAKCPSSYPTNSVKATV